MLPRYCAHNNTGYAQPWPELLVDIGWELCYAERYKRTPYQAEPRAATGIAPGRRLFSMTMTSTLTTNELAIAGAILQRSMMAATLGQQFSGLRQIYDVLGYPQDISAEMYRGKYAREDIASVIVDLPAQDTWTHWPRFTDGDNDDTPFMADWKELCTILPVWVKLQLVDRLSGVGRYGVLLIGARGATALETELPPGSLTSPRDVLYLKVLAENRAPIGQFDTDENSPRFGLPVLYRLQLGESTFRTVHYSRLIHVAEDPLDDDVYGTPRLQKVWNRLEDLLKLVGGSAEATWRVMDRGLHIDAREGFFPTADQADDITDELEKYLHGYQRYLRTGGMDVTPLGSTVVDPTGPFSTQIDLISAATRIPKRYLMGSERGELASSQDAVAWDNTIKDRQTNYAEQNILRAFINLLVKAGALRPPTEKLKIEWNRLVKDDEQSNAAVGLQMTDALVKYADSQNARAVVPSQEFREKMLHLTPDVPDEYKQEQPLTLPAVPLPGERATNGTNGTNATPARPQRRADAVSAG